MKFQLYAFLAQKYSVFWMQSSAGYVRKRPHSNQSRDEVLPCRGRTICLSAPAVTCWRYLWQSSIAVEGAVFFYVTSWNTILILKCLYIYSNYPVLPAAYADRIHCWPGWFTLIWSSIWFFLYLASNWTILLVLAFNKILWPQCLHLTGSFLLNDNLDEHSAQIYFRVASLACDIPAAAASRLVGIANPSLDIICYTWLETQGFHSFLSCWPWRQIQICRLSVEKAKKSEKEKFPRT